MNWFPENERSITISIISFLNSIALACGFFWPGSVFKNYDENTDIFKKDAL
jgi:hypothetical protein